jgi:hypothetical protein
VQCANRHGIARAHSVVPSRSKDGPRKPRVVRQAHHRVGESGRGTHSKASATVEIDPRYGLFGAVRSPYM